MSYIKTPDGINWYYQQSGNGPHVVLIPSGEGDCSAFDAIIKHLSRSFTVTTFDMPGMSRTSAPADAVREVTGESLATQVLGLMDALQIPEATYYGCSSGACTAFALQAFHSERVRNVILHELPTLDTNAQLPEFTSSTAFQDINEPFTGFVDALVGDRDAWQALGPEYHGRVAINMKLWAQTYIPSMAVNGSAMLNDTNNLHHKPIDWTIGGLQPVDLFFRNAEVALKNGISISLLPTRHFPQIHIPEQLAEHIERVTRKYL